MRYKDENLVDEYLLAALEEINRNQDLQSVVNRLFVIDELYTHTANVAKLGVQLAMDMGLPDEMVRKICMAGVLHDTGKILTPKDILFKPGKLTDIEFAVIKRHSFDGYNLCKGAGVDEVVLEMVLRHHEKLDGTGYPGVSGNKLPVQCTILTVADIFSALVEPRLYHRERTVDDAFAFISTFEGLDQMLVSRLKDLVKAA